MKNTIGINGGKAIKVLAINGSARKDGNTAILMNTVLNELNSAGIETELIQLAGKTISPCHACWGCAGRKNCVHVYDAFCDIFEKMKDAFAVIVLAAGKGTRFGGDKLNAIVRNRPMYEHMLDKVQAFGAFPAFVVTGSRRIAEDAAKRGITPVENREPERGISHSLILGLKAALRHRPERVLKPR